MGLLEQQAFQNCVEKVIGSKFGETVTFRGAPVTADINHASLRDGAEAEGEINFLVAGRAVVTVLSTAVASAPTEGEWFEDSNGRFYRIESVEYTGHAYECVCKPSATPQ